RRCATFFVVTRSLRIWMTLQKTFSPMRELRHENARDLILRFKRRVPTRCDSSCLEERGSSRRFGSYWLELGSSHASPETRPESDWTSRRHRLSSSAHCPTSLARRRAASA